MSDTFKKYIFKIENEKLRLEYSYYSHDYDSETQIANADIHVRLIDKANSLVEYLPDTIRWEIILTNKRLPLHP